MFRNWFRRRAKNHKLRLANNHKPAKSIYTWILDNGHGGVIDGVYQTKGKRSPKFDDGTQLYEGVFNRNVVNKLTNMLKEHNIDFIVLVPELEDTSLDDRIRKANEHQNKLKNCVFMSVHGNALNTTWNDANGVEVFFYKKGTKYSRSGLKLAEMMQKHLVTETGLRDRGAKGANYAVLRETTMPAILTENGFMTNKTEVELMMSDEFIEKVAKAHLKFILEVEKNKPI